MLLSPWIDVQDLSMILVLRSGRLLRSFRLLRFVPDADRLWSGARRGLKASLGVLLALGLYNFALGLCACYFFGELSEEHFGNPLISVYSIFKVFTVEGWYDIPDTIAMTMNDMQRPTFEVVGGVCVGQSEADVVDDADGEPERKPHPGLGRGTPDAREVDAVDVFHRDVECAVVFSDFVHAHDVGVIEGGGDPRLVEKIFDELRIVGAV